MDHLRKRERYLEVFLWGLGVAALIFVPFIAFNKGIFLFAGDYNVQQIPFFQLAQDAVRSGHIFFDFGTDLGVNFIGSYAFSPLGSVFFWVSMLFPREAVPYLLGVFLIVKFALSALFAYCYITRFVRNSEYAVLGGLLYAFSGFSVYNIFFNHFNEVIVFFPLLLLSLECLMIDRRRGFFAAMVCLSCLGNYFFFVGQVTFLILYFLCRAASGDYRLTWGKFLSAAFESVAGVALAAFLLFPAVLAVAGNPRVDHVLHGYDIFIYRATQTYAAIVHAMFYPPEVAYSLNFFPDAGVRWTSLSAYLPLVSMVGVLAFLKIHADSWLSRILKICCVMAFVPILNTSFYLFNHSYYARWFYMPVLCMCLASAAALEDYDERAFHKAYVTTALFTVFFAAMGVAPKLVGGESVWFSLVSSGDRLWASVSAAFFGLILLGLLFDRIRSGKPIYRQTLVFLAATAILVADIYIGTSKMSPAGDQQFVKTAIEVDFQFPDDGDLFYRTDFLDCNDNQAMFMQKPSISAFNSIVPPSIMAFYPKVGVTRDVSSKPSQDVYALRALLSVKYLVAGEDTEVTMPGFRKLGAQDTFVLYENDAFVPMGFTYDRYVTQEDFDSTSVESRGNLLLRALLLTDDQIARYGGALSRLSPAERDELYGANYLAAAAERREAAAQSFVVTKTGFYSDVALPRDNLVFYSVPYDSGWRAYVDGQPVPIERVSIGFVGIPCPAGSHRITLVYETPGLILGLYTTGGAAAALLLYLAAGLLIDRRRRGALRVAAGRADKGAGGAVRDAREALGLGGAEDAPDGSPEGEGSPPDTTDM